MFAIILLTLLAAAIGAAAVVRRRFRARGLAAVRRLESAPSRPARNDLPSEVEALARRLGARSGSTVARWRQTGSMTLRLGGSHSAFTAEQTAAVGEVGFVWRARLPASGVEVFDSVNGDEARLEARLAGIIPVAQLAGSDALWRGEAMRYLAELIWNPDAIFANAALRWKMLDSHHFVVATGEGARNCEVTLILDESGRPGQLEAADRPRMDGNTVVATPWRGRASDWREIEGRSIPTSAEVAWIVDGREQVYWRGRIDSWSAL